MLTQMKTTTDNTTTRADFAMKLKGHDWYYAYSDDHRFYSAGRISQNKLLTMHKELECPYSLKTLQIWAHKMILENFVEEKPGEWYPNPRKYQCIAPTPREGLMTQAYHDEITQWMSLGSTAEQIAKFV